MPDLKERLTVLWGRFVPAPLRRLVWDRGHPPSPFVLEHLRGRLGVEIGAGAHNDYKLRAINVDRYPEMDTIYKHEELRLSGRMAAIDLVSMGDDLPLRDETVDFVFASHVIEHFPDPLRALEEWSRVARDRIVVVVPHRDRTFDAGRDLSTPEELLERYRSGFTSAEDKHWSVWTRESFVAMCDAAGFPVIASQDPDDKVGNGFTVVIDATGARASAALRRGERAVAPT